MKLKLLLIISAMCLANSAWAATYYVATTGNDSNPGTLAAPWRTFQKAADTVGGGDTVYFRAGTYASVRIRELDPPAGQWITFKPYQNEKVIIDSRTGTGISIGGSSYLIFEGFEVTNTNYPHHLVRSCDLQNDPGGSCRALAESLRGGGGTGISLPGTYTGNAASDNHHLIFRNNELHHNLSYGIIAGGWKAGTTGHHDIEVTNNQFHSNGIPGLKEGYGTYLKGRRLLVRGNVAYRNTGNNFRFATRDHVGTDELIDSIIENNISYETEGPWLHAGTTGVVDAGAGIVVWGGINNIVRNNLVYNTRGMGVFISGVDPARPDMIYNNTIYGNGTNGISLTQNAIARNNIVFNNARRQPVGQILLNGNSRAENNLVGGSGLMIDSRGTSTASNNRLNVDPLLWDPANGDFGLKLLSPAIDAGVTLSEVKQDFSGTPRPNGPNYDIGAFEGSGSKPNPAPGGGSGPGAGGGSPPCCI